jgi:hypothetical protein
MTFPPTCTIVGTYSDVSGNPVRGTITFTPTAELGATIQGIMLPQLTVTTTLNNGTLTVALLPTDTAGITPTGWGYKVVETIQYNSISTITSSYYIQPTGTGTLNIAEIAQYATPPVLTAYGTLAGTNTWSGTNHFNGTFTLDGTTIQPPPGGETKFLAGDGTWQTVSTSAPVTSVFTRTGAITAQTGDYSFGQLTGTAAPAQLPAATNAAQGAVELTGDLGGSAASPQVTATHLAAPLPFAQGGTGQITQQAALNALAGGVTNAEYLRGNGTNLALSTIQAADLPAATTGAQGAVEYGSNLALLQPAGPAALGSTSTAADLGHTHPLQTYQFSVYAYGAKGDGKISNTGATNATTTVTIGEAVLTSADVGKVVMVKNALNTQSTAGQTTSVGTITAVNSSTSFTATWNTTPTQTASGLQVLWATDDTAAFQSAIAAANTFAQSHGLGEITVPAPTGLFFGIGGVLKNTDGVNAVFNSQLTIPINAERNANVTLVFKGTGDGGQTRYWNTSSPAWSGSPLVSFGVFTSAANQTNSINGTSGGFGGNPSVIGGGTGHGGYGVGTPTPVYSNTCVVFRDISILTTHSNSGWTYSAANMYGMARFHAVNFTYGTVGVIELYNGNNGDFTNVTLLSAGLAIGLLMPSNGNNASNYLNMVVCNGGYTYALLATEHTVGNNVTLLYCWSGVCPCGNYGDSGSNSVSALHASWFDQLCVEACTYHVNVFGVGAASIGPIFHLVLDTEGTLQFRDTTSGTSLNAAAGEIRLNGSPSTVNLTAGTQLRIIKEQQVRGAVTAPSFSLGTAQINTFWRDATVVASGGTNITTIQVSSLAGGASAPAMTTIYTQAAAALPLITFRVPSGCWWVINASTGTAPSTAWVLD